MTEKNAEKKYIERFKNDYAFRTFFFSRRFSNNGRGIRRIQPFPRTGLLFRLEYGYRGVLPVAALHTFFHFVCGNQIREKGLRRTAEGKGEEKAVPRPKRLAFCNDISLIAPITLMALQKKEVNFSSVHAITIAAYTTYKIIMSAINFSKAKKNGNLSVKMLRNVNLVDALVSVLSLQYALVMTFGGGIEGDMLFLCAFSSLAVWVFLIILSVVNAVKSRKK